MDDKNEMGIVYKKRGYSTAAEMGGGINSFRNSARSTASEIVKNDSSSSKEENDKERTRKNESITSLRDEIKIREEKIEIERQHKTTIERIYVGKVKLWLTTIVAVGLGLALYGFYWLTIANVIHHLTIPVAPGLMTQTMNLQTLWNNFIELPVLLIVLCGFFAFFPLAIGLVLVQRKGEAHNKTWMQYAGVIGTLLFVFALDFLIALVIEKQLYDYDSLIRKVGDFATYVLKDILGTFGAILFLGFGAYVIWGEIIIIFFKIKDSETHMRICESEISTCQKAIDEKNLK